MEWDFRARDTLSEKRGYVYDFKLLHYTREKELKSQILMKNKSITLPKFVYFSHDHLHLISLVLTY
jgi:hypothetical protein